MGLRVGSTVKLAPGISRSSQRARIYARYTDIAKAGSFIADIQHFDPNGI